MNEKNNHELSIDIQKINCLQIIKNQTNINWVNEWLNQTACFCEGNELSVDSIPDHEYLNEFKFYLN
jgi:hypothetical protein